ncbi:hypothetical protein BGZ70_002668 [Mortierella alpina]|uniref:Uncharacterized protein n=1 Tax=Mortierella alpina TaxID=64518 RepID=A0A9P6ITM6_MORAP|nr:hypothetical protein BGZ70_002668 [Mortierella alpina]
MSSSLSHIGIAGILEGNPRSSSGAVAGNLASLFSSDRRNKKGHNRSGSNGALQQGSKENDPASRGNNGTDAVKDHGRKNSGDSLMSLRMKKDLLLKKISSNSSNDEDQEPGSGHGTTSRGSSLSGFLGHRRKGSLTVGSSNTSNNNNSKASSSQGQELMQRSSPSQQDLSDRQQSSWGQEPLQRGLERSKLSTLSSSQAKREVDLYPLGRPFETTRDFSQLPPTAPVNGFLSPAPGTPTATTTAGATSSARPSLSPSGSSGASSLASSSSSSSRSAFLQQKSQAALGATKAWVKRSLEDRRASEEDPLLTGKMRMD